jgi:sensor histidine kinase YesM
MMAFATTEDDSNSQDNRRGVDFLNLTGWKKRLLLFGIWTILGLSEAGRLYYRYNIDQIYYHWCHTVFWGLVGWYIWGLLYPVIALIVRRFSFSRDTWGRTFLVHLSAAFLLSLVQLFLYAVVTHFGNIYIFDDSSGSLTQLLELYPRFMLQRGMLYYFMIAFVTYAVGYYCQYRKAELRRAAAETELVRAQLAVLKGQLHPHFLFNTLNAVTALIPTEPVAAEEVVTDLSELLRATLDYQDVQQHPLAEEVAFLDRYLAIQKTRFRDRLRVEKNIPADALGLLVPTMILQPVVENAILHAVSNRVDGGSLNIEARRDSDLLLLIVTDDGPGLPPDWEKASERGIGLKNTRQRLRQLYGDRHRFELSDSPSGGLQVRLGIPIAVIQDHSPGAR